MTISSPQWRWQDGAVDPREEHIELRYGELTAGSWDDWRPLGRIGRPRGKIFPVQWLISADIPENQPMVAAARQELDYYLVEKGEADPWAYAKYHCGTGANAYSIVHWSYFPGR